MPSSGKRDIGALLADTRLIEGAMREGVRKALIRHKQAGRPAIVWRDGQIVPVPPEELDELIRELDAGH